MEMLVRAAEAGSFARAARLLQIDPSAISHAVADLEKELGVTLFYRTTRRLSLTEEGRDICERARDILAQLAALDAAARPRKALAGTLRVGISVAISRTVIMPRLSQFMRRHPQLELQFYVLAQVQEMHAGGLDVMLRGGPPPESGLIARKLAEITFGVYGAPAYLEASGEPREPADLARHRCFVHVPPPVGRPLDEWTFEQGGKQQVIKVPRALVTDDREGMIDAVLDGGGLMRIGLFNPALISAGRLRKVLTAWRCVGHQPIYALYRKSSPLAPKITAFLEFVDETFSAFDPEELTLVHHAAATALPKRKAT
jgi:DNA-binding transcriptional LysR family regulator